MFFGHFPCQNSYSEKLWDANINNSLCSRKNSLSTIDHFMKRVVLFHFGIKLHQSEIEWILINKWLIFEYFNIWSSKCTAILVIAVMHPIFSIYNKIYTELGWNMTQKISFELKEYYLWKEVQWTKCIWCKIYCL